MSKRSYDKRSDDPKASCGAPSVDARAISLAGAALPDEGRVVALAEIFSALGDPTRLRILIALGAQDLCVCDIAAVVGSSQSAVSHQLRILRHLDLVCFRREGKRAVYSLADDHVRLLLEQGSEHAAERFGGSGE